MKIDTIKAIEPEMANLMQQKKDAEKKLREEMREALRV